MRIYLIRHGRQNSPLCNVNVPLSDAGRRQAELLGKRLKKESIDAVWSSDLIRARETADIINEKIRAPRIIREGLREISFGDLEGLSDDVIMERYADFFAARASMKQDLPYPGGESAADMDPSCRSGHGRNRKSGAETVAVVTHGGVIRSLVTHYLHMDGAYVPLLARHLENCGITEFYYRESDGEMLLNRFNDFAHLTDHPELFARRLGREKVMEKRELHSVLTDF